jgi:hypothetical protein
LESAIRNCDNFQVTKDDVEKIIDWENTSPKQVEIPFKPARVLLQVCSLISEIVLVWILIRIVHIVRLVAFTRTLLEYPQWSTLLACGMLWISSAMILTRSIRWFVNFPFYAVKFYCIIKYQWVSSAGFLDVYVLFLFFIPMIREAQIASNENVILQMNIVVVLINGNSYIFLEHADI